MSIVDIFRKKPEKEQKPDKIDVSQKKELPEEKRDNVFKVTAKKIQDCNWGKMAIGLANSAALYTVLSVGGVSNVTENSYDNIFARDPDDKDNGIGLLQKAGIKVKVGTQEYYDGIMNGEINLDALAKDRKDRTLAEQKFADEFRRGARYTLWGDKNDTFRIEIDKTMPVGTFEKMNDRAQQGVANGTTFDASSFFYSSPLKKEEKAPTDKDKVKALSGRGTPSAAPSTQIKEAKVINLKPDFAQLRGTKQELATDQKAKKGEVKPLDPNNFTQRRQQERQSHTAG